MVDLRGEEDTKRIFSIGFGIDVRKGTDESLCLQIN